MTLKVIVDSNFLMIPSQFHLNIFKELQRVLNRDIKIIILLPIYEELLNISKNSGPKLKKQAEMTLKLIEGFEIINIRPNCSENVDDFIAHIAKKWDCPVATNDRKLRKKLRDINVSAIYLRHRTHLEVEGVKL